MSSKNSPYGTFSNYVQMKPYLTPRNPETGNYYKIFSIYRNIRSSVSMPVYVTNPLYEASIDSFDKSKYKEFIDNLSVSWYINNYLLLKGTFSASFKLQDEDMYVDPSSGTFSNSDIYEKGTYKDGEIRTSKWNLNALLSYNRQLGKHNLNFTLGVEASETKSNSTYAYYEGFVEGAVPSPSNALMIKDEPTFQDSNTRRFGTYLQFNYTYNNIYLFDVSGRYDGSSAFGANQEDGDVLVFRSGDQLPQLCFHAGSGFFEPIQDQSHLRTDW